MRDELARRDIVVNVADNDTVIRIPESTLSFKSGDDKIAKNQQVQKAITEIGLVLYQAVQKENRFTYLDTIFVEGHTDSDGIYYRGKGNWGLSVDRAISVWNLWQKELDVTPKLGDLKNAFGQRLFSVSGYAATRRVNLAENTPVDKAKNRRIDIRFTVKKPSIADLKRIVN